MGWPHKENERTSLRELGIQMDNGRPKTRCFWGVFVDFYTKLFSSSGVTNIDRVLEGVQKVVTDDMNAELQKLYTKEEVDVAIKQMAPSKAPGPDGMPPLFYQSF